MDAQIAVVNSKKSPIARICFGRARARGATKDNTRDTTASLIRNYVKRVQTNPATTDTQRAGLGITIPDTERTPTQVPPDAPLIELDWSKRGQCIIHAGTNPGNEALNKMGPFGKNLLFHFRNAGDADWQYLGVASKSPFIHVIGNSQPVSLEYRAAYLNSKGQQGPWSEIDTAYVGKAA